MAAQLTLDQLVEVRIFDREREVKMPWRIERDYGDCNGYAVVKEGTNEIEGCHATRAEAVAQQRALYASESKKNVSENPGSIWDGTFIEKGYN
jgi:hypothetical protein